ncbi:MAG: hypothetical protein ACR2P5_03265 [Gammaproteobacteria bacterium]
MYIPDPVELMEARQEQLMDEWEAAQQDVPENSFRCPYCGNVSKGELISLSADPSAPVMCYDCLPDDTKAAFDKFKQYIKEQK